MPSYLPTDVRIRLSASNLYDTTTRTVVEKKGETAAGQAEVAQARLKESAFLNEERVQFPGDTHNFGLNFLNNVPFKQVQVGADLFRLDLETEGQERRASMRSARMQAKWEYDGDVDEKEGEHSIRQRPTRAHPAPSSSLSGAMGASPFADYHKDELVPKALSLHVMLGDQSFLRGYDNDKPQRCMIDVFFNGQLSSSVLVNWKEIHTWHQVFSGIRVGHMVEWPWVVLPPGQNANGSLRGLKRAISVNERWQQISSALMQEVKARGVNQYGERPPSADYLHSLATMQMSEAVERLQKPGGRRFGVVDVMITAGDGKKLNNGMSYLKSPMRIVDERYKRRHGEDKSSSRSPEQSSDQDAEGETDEEFEQKSSFTPALVPPTPWPTIPLLSSPLFPPTFSGSPQLPQMPLPLPSVLIFPPFPTALPGSSSANTSMQSGPCSSPVLNPLHLLGESQSYNSSSSTPMLSDPIPVLGASYPSLLPTRPRQVSFSHANVASFNPRAPPSNSAVGLGISERALLPIQNSPSQISLLAHRPADSRTPVLFRGNPFDPPPLGPPPPVGFFSTPISVVDRTTADSTTVDPGLPPLSILLTRFVITGKRGKRIVDHRWKVAQRIAMKKARSGPTISHSRSLIRSPTKNRQKSPGSKDYSDATARSGRRSRSNYRLTTPPSPSSPIMVDPDMTMSIDKKKRDSIHDSQFIRGPSKPLSRGPTRASILESHPFGARTRLEDDADTFVDNGSATIPNIPAIVSHRHGHQTLPFMGVQGPKAASFIFDNPEELLRQRARSPTKQDTPPVAVTSHPSQLVSSVEATVTATSTPRNPTSVSRAFNPLESGGLSISSAPSSRPNNSAPEFQIVNFLESGSSDLSSAPSSPDVALSQTVISAHLSSVPLEDIPGQPLSAVKPPDMLHTSLASACETLTEEGRRAPSPSAPSSPRSPEIPLSQTRRVVTTQATSAFAFQPVPQVQPHLTAPRTYISPQKPSTSSTSYTSYTSFASPTRPKSPPKKKRRIASSSSRSQPKTKIPAPPVDTSKNPPLNQDSVLAFAVTGTAGMEGEGKVLRQVKSERQGVFDESEVVCGMRFFVAG